MKKSAAEILRQRAARLARVLKEEKREHVLQIVSFELGAEIYAIEAKYLQEIMPLKEFTPLPTVPQFVKGLVNVRHKILPLFDLSLFLGIPNQEKVALKIVVLSGKGTEFACCVDTVLGTKELNVNELQPPLSISNDLHRELTLGITIDGITVLDGAKILTDKRLIVEESFDE